MSITGRAKVAGVLGWPVSHSLSPSLHGFWINKYNVDGAYLPFNVSPDNLKTAIEGITDLGLRGANLTIPHKEAALSYINNISESAKKIGAINTLVVDPEIGIIGENTDAFGFSENLKDIIPDLNLKNKIAVVLGAGGASRAVCFSLMTSGVSEIRLINRSKPRAISVRDKFSTSIVVETWDNRDKALENAEILINTTSLGMVGQPDLSISLAKLPISATVCDLVYVPIATPLLIQAQKRGNKIVDGLGMLLHQARPGFERWFGIEPKVTTDLRDYILNSQKEC